jgi:K+-transporting ATPase ATPase A chain
MNIQGWLEIVFTIVLAVALAWPLGLYLARVWQEEPTWLDPVIGPVERLIYRLAGIDPAKGQGWVTYAIALLSFSAVGFVVLYAILRLQGQLPFNPQGFAGMSPDLAFNTAISFVSNTNWQAYSGESAASHFSQMAGLTVQNFVSPVVAMAVAAALARAFAANRGESIGNFWADLIRTTLYLFLPLSIVVALILAALGVPQTLLAHVDAHTLEGARQSIALGPVASQEAIKQLGTNGGGFFGANSAHPFENPSSLTNLIETVAMLVVGFACAIAFGVVADARKEAWALVAAMVILVGAGAAAVYAAETRATPALVAAAHAHGQVRTSPNMEGKEVRFGAASSALFVAVTTAVSDGAIVAQHESLTPAGGGVALFLMQLGELAPGGDGSGLYAMVHMALLAVFIAGLMVGRTPEYLGKKIEAREIKYVMLSALIMTVAILGFAAVALVLPAALKGLGASGPHGLSEVLYAYTSGTANNGSAFGGLTANSPWYNVTIGIAMALGRYGYIVPVLAVAGSLVGKPKLAPTAGTLPTHTSLFVGLLIGVIIVLGGLQFFPALALGPIVEHFQMLALMRP